MEIPKKICSKNGRVSSCYQGHRNVNLLRMCRRPHSHSIKWVDQGVVYPKGVRIIDVFYCSVEKLRANISTTKMYTWINFVTDWVMLSPDFLFPHFLVFLPANPIANFHIAFYSRSNLELLNLDIAHTTHNYAHTHVYTWINFVTDSLGYALARFLEADNYAKLLFHPCM